MFPRVDCSWNCSLGSRTPSPTSSLVLWFAVGSKKISISTTSGAHKTPSPILPLRRWPARCPPVWDRPMRLWRALSLKGELTWNVLWGNERSADAPITTIPAGSFGAHDLKIAAVHAGHQTLAQGQKRFSLHV
ncbi:uncharacterized protein CIMG_12089 [Coccidioides immitis RS]|uniref:Uncharacterized protein n=1 Tax=Coccidioides immitis (strain RS) TaxID=246410 RepID=A0A0D8JU70_COCIM|nr:uncharacterized protein CIMG_12089 [Coccidioides immitis RS]KJF60837.1 hypothetical protein CIMG_12089 [Coccidioides immitis RS]